jgi:hypothetical protein
MKDVNGNRRRWSSRRVRRSAPANLAVAALPLGARAQQSAGLEPRQLFGYGRSNWSSKLTQDLLSWLAVRSPSAKMRVVPTSLSCQLRSRY